MPAADFTLDELGTVIHDPAYRRVLKPRGGGILLAPGNHALCSVHMADTGPGLEAGDCCGTGIAKEVQDADFSLCLSDFFHGPVPVCGLLGKEAGVLKVHRFDKKGQLTVADAPVLGKIPLIPAAAAGLAAAVTGIAVIPVGISARRIPDGLRVGPHQIIAPPALQLLAL